MGPKGPYSKVPNNHNGWSLKILRLLGALLVLKRFASLRLLGARYRGITLIRFLSIRPLRLLGSPLRLLGAAITLISWGHYAY